MINEQVLLKDILIKDDLKDFLYTNYNALGSLIKRPLTTEYAEAIALIITQRFAIFENCPTVYETVDTGIAQIHNFIKTINLFALVNEIRNSIDSFNTDAGKLHRQSKFNPIDNDNIDDAPIEIDDTEFTLGQNWLDNINFIIENSKKLKKFANLVINITYITPAFLGE